MLLSVGAGETYASKMAQLTISGAMGLELVDIASMIGLFGLPCDFVFTSRALNSQIRLGCLWPEYYVLVEVGIVYTARVYYIQ